MTSLTTRVSPVPVILGGQVFPELSYCPQIYHSILLDPITDAHREGPNQVDRF